MITKADIKDTAMAIKDTIWDIIGDSVKTGAKVFCVGSGIAVGLIMYHANRHKQHLEWKDDE